MAKYHQRWLLGDGHAGRIMETVSDTSLMDDLDARTAMAEMLLKQTCQKTEALPPLKLMSESCHETGDGKRFRYGRPVITEAMMAAMDCPFEPWPAYIGDDDADRDD